MKLLYIMFLWSTLCYPMDSELLLPIETVEIDYIPTDTDSPIPVPKEQRWFKVPTNQLLMVVVSVCGSAFVLSGVNMVVLFDIKKQIAMLRATVHRRIPIIPVVPLPIVPITTDEVVYTRSTEDKHTEGRFAKDKTTENTSTHNSDNETGGLAPYENSDPSTVSLSPIDTEYAETVEESLSKSPSPLGEKHDDIMRKIE
jgi:hypothetical protein